MSDPKPFPNGLMRLLDSNHDYVLDRFMSNCFPEPNSGCWIWVGNHTKGYGTIYFGAAGKSIQAHRLSMQLFRDGAQDGALVLHKCDNSWCVNPDHLYAGTAQQNVSDRDTRLRGAVLHRNPNAKLTLAQALEIRRMYVRGSRTAGGMALAKRYGVSPSAIHDIGHGVYWKEATVSKFLAMHPPALTERSEGGA